MTFVARILRYLRASRMPPTAFGRAVVNDPRFVHDLLHGREPRRRTVAHVLAWIDEREASARGAAR